MKTGAKIFNGAGLLLTLSLTSCGKSNNTVLVRIRTGLESVGSKANLMDLFSAPTNYPITGYCVQNNLYAGTDAGIQNSDLLDTQRVDLSTAYSSAPTFTITSNELAQPAYASFPLISIPVPRGIEVGVGLLGSLANSQSVGAGGRCSDFNGLIPYSTTSVIGHKRIIANQALDLALNVWIVPSKGVTNIVAPTPAAGDPNCADDRDEHQHCAPLDFLQVACTGCTSASAYLTFEYARDRNDPLKRVVQHVPAADTASVNIPDILPMTVTAMSGGSVLGSFDIRDELWPNGSGLLTGIQLNVAPLVTLTVLKRQRMPTPTPPPIGFISAPSVTGGGPGGPTITWSNASNATHYDVAYSPSSGGPWTTIVMPNVMGTTVMVPNSNFSSAGANFIAIVAKNNLGSTPFTSAASPIVVLGAIIPPSLSNSSGRAVVSFNYPPGPTSGQNCTVAAINMTNGTTTNYGTVFVSPASPTITIANNWTLTPGFNYVVQVTCIMSPGGYSLSPQSTSVTF